jgi:hypothetical protein
MFYELLKMEGGRALTTSSNLTYAVLFSGIHTIKYALEPSLLLHILLQMISPTVLLSTVLELLNHPV